MMKDTTRCDDVPLAPGGRAPWGHFPMVRKGLLPVIEELREHGPLLRMKLGPMSLVVINDGRLMRQVLMEKADAFDGGRQRLSLLDLTHKPNGGLTA
ncbi:hypothetical protein ACWD1Z_37355, partial [Streptomyces sp. NPDC002784]